MKWRIFQTGSLQFVFYYQSEILSIENGKTIRGNEWIYNRKDYRCLKIYSVHGLNSSLVTNALYQKNTFIRLLKRQRLRLDNIKGAYYMKRFKYNPTSSNQL